MIVKCKAVLLSSMMSWMLIIELPLFVLMFLFLNIFIGYVFLMCSSVFFISLLYIFYKNKFELLTVSVDGSTIYLSFVNNSFFKRPDIKTTKDMVKVEQGDGQLMISMDGQLQAILRQKAVPAESWSEINQVLR